MRRLRATARLHSVIYALCLVPSACAFAFGAPGLALIGLLLIGFAEPVEMLLVLCAARSRGTPARGWFVDLDVEQRETREQFVDETRDNPTIR